MNPAEITAYLDVPYIAVVATISRNGVPHHTPNWYRYNGKVLTLITRTDRLKDLNLQRNNRISVCIYDPPVASNYVVITGSATCHDQDIWDEARRIIALQGADRGGRLSRALANGAPGADHGDPGAHRDASVRGTVSCREANGSESRPAIWAHRPDTLW